MTKIFQKLYVPLRYKKSLPFKSGFCLHQPPGRVPFYHLPWWHLLHEGSCSVFELSKASRKSSPSYSESCSPGKAVAVSFFRKPGLDKSLAEFQRRQRGRTRGDCLIPYIGQFIHIPGFVYLSPVSWSATQMKALVLQLLCFTSVAFSLRQQRNNGPLLRFLLSSMLESLCLIFVSDFFVN